MVRSISTMAALLLAPLLVGCGAPGGDGSLGEGDGASGTDGDMGGQDGAPGGGGSSDDSLDDACAGVDCGKGSCIVDESGTPACNCRGDRVDVALRCQPCDPIGEMIDIPRVEISGAITFNDQDPPTSQYQDGELVLRGRGSGDEVVLGGTRDGTFRRQVVPGTYDLYYRHDDGGLVPQNQNFRLSTVSLHEATELDVSIPVVHLSGAVTIDGATPPTSQYQDGNLFLENPTHGDVVPLGSTRAGHYETMIVPGVYELHYRVEDGGSEVPINGDAVVGLVTVEQSGSGDGQQADESNDVPGLVVDLDVPTVDLSGTLTINGSTPPSSQYDDGNLLLIDTRTGDATHLASTRDGSYQSRVVAGTYEIHYRREDVSGVVPINENAVLKTVDVTSDTELDVDIPVVEVTGTLLLDGQPPPQTAYDDAVISLRNLETGDVAVLGRLQDGSFSRRVVAGTYGLYYSVLSTTGKTPANIQARLRQSVDVGASSSLDIDIVTSMVSGTVTLDGQPPPQSAYEDGRLYLRSDYGDSVLLGSTSAGSFDRRIVEGDYSVHYSLEAGGDWVPINNDAAIVETTRVGSNSSFDINVPSSRISGGFQVAGATPPADVLDSGDVHLRDLATDDEVLLGRTHEGSFSATLAPGRYLAVYKGGEAGASVPHNESAELACVIVP